MLLTICTAALPGVRSDGNAWSDPVAQGPARTRVVTNDNRTPSGTVVNGVLELKLELTQGVWHPQNDNGVGLPVRVIGEEGEAPSNPAPLIRVREGTELHISVRNTLKQTMKVIGLRAHPSLNSETTMLKLGSGATGDVRFRAGAAGTYYYYAESEPTGDRNSEVLDAQMAGVFVVDPPDGPADDRIFAINLVEEFETGFHPWLGAFVINGKAWPHTERLTYRVGEHARWRVINLSALPHPMHMHGSYFTVTGVGNGDRDTIYSDEDRRAVVTEPVRPGQSFRVEWVPERTGRWVFHCHLASHFAEDTLPHITYPASPESGAASREWQVNGHEAHDATVASGGMGGLVLGITVLPGAEPAKAPTVLSSRASRKLELTVSKRTEPSAGGATFGYTVREGGRDLPPFDTMASPPIVLTQHQSVDVRIINRLSGPTAVHWHGIELDSYYDGVPGVGGSGRQVTPAIAPGGSFVARFVPPRAGTFIYHTHWHDVEQLVGGLYGPLIVMPPGQPFDPETDKIVVITASGKEDFDPLLVNGSRTPSPMTMKVGTRYRFRLIDIGANSLSAATVALLDGSTPLTWRAIAKDGADLPASQQRISVARRSIMVGETFDFEFVPDKPGRLTLDVIQSNDKTHVVTNIEVR